MPSQMPTDAIDPIDESRLLERLRARDERAFELLIRQYGPRLLRTARRLLQDEGLAQDAVQDGLLSALRALDRFRGASRISTWLHRIVVNAALMRLRARRRRPEAPIDDLLPQFEADGAWSSPPPPPGAALEAAEARRRVHDVLERLPERYRQVLVLRDLEEMDTDEVASLLGISGNAVKVRLHRARQALRTLLARPTTGWRPRAETLALGCASQETGYVR